MKSIIPSWSRHRTLWAVIALSSAMLLGGLDPASAKDKKNKDGYWDPYGHYHRYSDEKRKDKNGYWDQYGNYHRYNNEDGYWDSNGRYHRYGDERKNNRQADYINKGRQIWDILFN